MKNEFVAQETPPKRRRLGRMPGIKLVRTLRGHTNAIGKIAWSPDGRLLASPSFDHTVRIWDAKTGKCVKVLSKFQALTSVVGFSPAGSLLAVGGATKSYGTNGGVSIWTTTDYECIMELPVSRPVSSLAFDPTGQLLVLGGQVEGVIIYDTLTKDITNFSGQLRDSFHVVIFDRAGHRIIESGYADRLQCWHSVSKKREWVLQDGSVSLSLALDSTGSLLASGGGDGTVKLWNTDASSLLYMLEGHTSCVVSVAFIPHSSLLASKGMGGDGTVCLWDAKMGNRLACFPEPSDEMFPSGLACHPSRPILATVGTDIDTSTGKEGHVIRIWELDVDLLLGRVAEPSSHYVNAKVLLAGDSGVGKSGLSLVLNNQPFESTDSTPGRRVWTFDSQTVTVDDHTTQTRETLLWDLAGQPGYRVIHQLHLHEVAVALVVFDARSETDPLAGVRHWERALRLARQRQGNASVPMKRFLVSARSDRGSVSVSRERLQATLEEFGFDAYFETSAKEGWGVQALREAIAQGIDWPNLPTVSSSQLFADIKAFLLSVKGTGRLLVPESDLFDDFMNKNKKISKSVNDLRRQFAVCIGRLANRDLIRRLTFGGYVLLQPELLDAYASAMLNEAKKEPDGLGSLAESIVLAGRFFVPKEHKIVDHEQEQLLLHATVEELIRYDLTLRENADDGRYLVFPSQFNRDYEDAPEPKGKEVAITFKGPVQSIYATLAVRLGHSGRFATERAEMWRNAVIFKADIGGKCGLLLHEFAEAHGRLVLFYPDQQASGETRFHFEKFVAAHLDHRALDGTVDLVRFFVCTDCNEPVPDAYVRMRRAQGKETFDCPCGGRVSLGESRERMHFQSAVAGMDGAADRQREFDAFVTSAKGEASTGAFHAWAGGDQVTLALVFTDVVGSTALGERLRDQGMNEVRRAHFDQSRRLIGKYQGREIKTIGDSFMVAFKSVNAAWDYARALHRNTGHSQVQIRAGIHIGAMSVEENDVFGGAVNFAARVVGAISGAEIWLSDRAKQDIDLLGDRRYNQAKWQQHEGIALKGFSGTFTLWSVRGPDDR
ncbi:MAG: hypothetical protein H7838_09805 [Magnetococcus sp. DMHC-8]